MGEVFAGRYELVDPIGRGGVGAVWRAWDHRRRRYVAAKVLQQSDAHSLLRFVREQALRIDHPHVLAPASWAADDDKVLFTMDLVGGGSLAHLIGDYGPLPPSLVCTLVDQLLSGLAAVHAEDVVHRDIKPANVLLEATGTGRPRLRLSDFGIAMRLGEPRLTETNLVVGTPGYISPEQMMGSEPDFPADLFAVGLVALYLLEGAKPDAKALVQYFAAHGTPSAPKGIPEPLWQVVATLVQPDPQARFRTATGARKALAAAAELLPEPGPDDELIEIFDQLGPLPPGFGPTGPLKQAPGVRTGSSDTFQGSEFSGPGTGSGPLSGQSAPAPSAGSPPSGHVAPAPTPGFPPSEHITPGPGPGVRPSARDDDSAWPGTDSVPADPRRGHAPGAVPPDPRQGTGPRPAASLSESSGDVRSPSMSDTGSFPLPPPQATASSPQVRPPDTQAPAQAQQGAQHQPSHVSPDDPTHVLPSPRPQAPPYPTRPLTSPPLQRADASTASYTAQVPQVPPPAQEVSRHRAGRGARRARRRPGPPAKVVVPMLLLALACYAVGFWALTRL